MSERIIIMRYDIQRFKDGHWQFYRRCYTPETARARMNQIQKTDNPYGYKTRIVENHKLVRRNPH